MDTISAVIVGAILSTYIMVVASAFSIEKKVTKILEYIEKNEKEGK